MKSFLMTAGQLAFTLFMYAMGSVFFGLALTPGMMLTFKVWEATAQTNVPARSFFLGVTIAAGYFVFGLTLILLAGLTRVLFRLRLQEGRYPIFSLPALRWAFISSLYLMINYTFIDFILLTPFANLLFRLLGAKLGKNVQFNSKYIYDATLLEIGDNTVVGGGAIIGASAVLLKDTQVGRRQMWFGIPAEQVTRKPRQKDEDSEAGPPSAGE